MTLTNNAAPTADKDSQTDGRGRTESRGSGFLFAIQPPPPPWHYYVDDDEAVGGLVGGLVCTGLKLLSGLRRRRQKDMPLHQQPALVHLHTHISIHGGCH